MKKYLCIAVIVLLCISLLLFIFSKRGSDETILHACNALYSRLKDSVEFDHAIPNDDFTRFQLVNKSGEQYGEMPIQQPEWRAIRRIYRSGTRMFFVLGNSFDDENGLVFTEDSHLDMSGLWKAERRGSNVFYYQTYP